MNQLDERFEELAGTITPAQLTQLLKLQAALSDADDITGAWMALYDLQCTRHDCEPSGWPAVLQYWVDGEYREEDTADTVEELRRRLAKANNQAQAIIDGQQDVIYALRRRADEAETRLSECRRQLELLRGELAAERDHSKRRQPTA